MIHEVQRRDEDLRALPQAAAAPAGVWSNDAMASVRDPRRAPFPPGAPAAAGRPSRFADRGFPPLGPMAAGPMNAVEVPTLFLGGNSINRIDALTSQRIARSLS